MQGLFPVPLLQRYGLPSRLPASTTLPGLGDLAVKKEKIASMWEDGVKGITKKDGLLGYL